MQGMHQAVLRWLEGCPQIRDVFFGSGGNVRDTALFLPLSACEDAAVHTFIDGTTERRYQFALIRISDAEGSPNDAAAQQPVQWAGACAAWLQQQDSFGDLPALPGGCIATGCGMAEGSSNALTVLGESRVRVTLQAFVDYYDPGGRSTGA